MNIDARLAKLARSQHGLISRRQALQFGLTRSDIESRIARRVWAKFRRGVYIWGGTPPSYAQAVCGAVLSVPRKAVASHASAAALWGLGTRPRQGIDLLGLAGVSLRGRGIVAHHTTHLPSSHVGRAQGVDATSAARTLADLSGSLTPGALGELLDEAARRKLLTIEEFERCSATLRHAPGRHPATMSEALTWRVPGSGAGDSFLEKRALRALIAGGFPPPVQLHRVVLDGAQWEIDLAYPEAMLAIELDGFDFHSGRASFDRDRLKARSLVSNHWTVLAFTSTSSDAELVTAVGRILRRRGLVPQAPVFASDGALGVL